MKKNVKKMFEFASDEEKMVLGKLYCWCKIMYLVN